MATKTDIYYGTGMLGSRKGMTMALVRFSLPLIGAGVVQQSFNSIDVAVVGKFIGSGALAAVGANGPLISLIVTLFMGIALGANVVIANALGAGDTDRSARTVATCGIVAPLSGILLMIVGLFVAVPAHNILGTPDDVMPSAISYLRWYALGFPAMLVYNFAAAVLRSVGDTARPFYWLVAGGLLNVCLNLYFVTGLSMGVEGVAIATSVSNYVSAAGVTAILLRERVGIRLKPREMKIYASEFWQMITIGLPAGIQGTLFAFSNVFIQSGVNSLGTDVMAGSAAALNFELYGYFIISAFVQAAVAFISANYGAGRHDMCRFIFRRCMMLAVGGSMLLGLVVSWQSDLFVSLFVDRGDATPHAVERVLTVLAFQWIACSYEISGGAMRALGYSLTPMLITVFGTCVVRVWWVSTNTFIRFGDLLVIYPVTWILTGAGVYIAWLVVSRKVLQISHASSA